MRIGIIALLHESNTFSPQPTTIERFRENVLLEGETIRASLADTHHEVGGFFAGLAAGGAEAVPLFAARALPSGTIGRETFAELLDRMWQSLDRAAHLDGILVAPHGATVSQNWPDADGYWLQQLRHRVGDEMPIIGTLDPHANLSPAMVSSCHALLAYRTNPHLDQRQRGEQAADLMLRTVRGENRPTMAALFPPLAISIDRQCTDEPPLRELCQWADAQRQRPGILANSIFFGFPYADVPEMGSAAIVVTDNDPSAAERLVRELAGRMWDQRQQFAGVYTGVEEALDQVEGLDGPVCLLDMGDNVGGGSSADGTQILAALAQRQMGPAFVCLFDPQAVAACEQAASRSRLSICVGGKTDDLHGPPVPLEVTVRSIHDGQFREPQPRHGGMSDFDQGRTAVCTTDWGLTLMLTSRRMVPFSLQQLVSCDIDPRQFRVLVAKGVNAPLAAYREVCPHFIRVNTSGSTCADMQELTYTYRRRPMFPFETGTEWDAQTAEITPGMPAQGVTRTGLATHSHLRSGIRRGQTNMPPLAVRQISAAETYPLRNLVLRPGKPESACQWPGDDDPESFHAGVFLDEALVAIASVVPQAMAGGESDTAPAAVGVPGSFRLRGMATHPQYRGQGLGSALLKECIERTRAGGGKVLWCNARTPAADFYRRAGFETVGDEFVLPEIGPHLRMQLRLTEPQSPEANT